VDLDFGVIATTSFRDPIFNDTWHRGRIDHVLYTNDPNGLHRIMPDGKPIFWDKYRHASDHYPVSVTT
jgi:endonuclease/exonuclease/phosphatase family metal-dependent hydrolase